MIFTFILTYHKVKEKLAGCRKASRWSNLVAPSTTRNSQIVLNFVIKEHQLSIWIHSVDQCISPAVLMMLTKYLQSTVVHLYSYLQVISSLQLLNKLRQLLLSVHWTLIHHIVTHRSTCWQWRLMWMS